MTRGTSEQTIVVSAMIVGGIWAYQQYQQGGQDIDFTKFATAWGAIFLLLALIAMASPELASALAILIVAGDLLNQGSGLLTSITSAESGTSANTQAKPAGSTATKKAPAK
jgi:hypothetical protein